MEEYGMTDLWKKVSQISKTGLNNGQELANIRKEWKYIWADEEAI